MLTTPHSVTGAAIATIFPNLAVAIPVSLVAHFILDTIPHWQEVIKKPYKPIKTTYFRLPADIILAVLLVWLIAKNHPTISTVIWSSALVSNLPDLDVVATNFLPQLLQKSSVFKRYYDWHCRIQKETKSLIGIFTQVAVIIAGLIATLR